MLTADLRQALLIAHAHRLDDDGRCVACHSTSVSSGRTFGCTLGAAARLALRGLPTPPPSGQGGTGDPV